MSPNRSPEDRAIVFGSTVILIIVSAIAGYISYGHAHDLATLHGYTPSRAWALPITIDGAIIASSFVILRSRRQNRSVPFVAWFTLLLSISTTVFSNVYAGRNEGPVGWFVAGWPALAMLLTFEMAMLTLRQPKVTAAPATASDVTDDHFVQTTDLPSWGRRLSEEWASAQSIDTANTARIDRMVKDLDDRDWAQWQAEADSVWDTILSSDKAVKSASPDPHDVVQRTTDGELLINGEPVTETPVRETTGVEVPSAEFLAPRDDAVQPNENPKMVQAMQIYADALARGETMTQTQLATAIGQKSRRVASQAIARVKWDAESA